MLAAMCRALKRAVFGEEDEDDDIFYQALDYGSPDPVEADMEEEDQSCMWKWNWEEQLEKFETLIPGFLQFSEATIGNTGVDALVLKNISSKVLYLTDVICTEAKCVCPLLDRRRSNHLLDDAGRITLHIPNETNGIALPPQYQMTFNVHCWPLMKGTICQICFYKLGDYVIIRRFLVPTEGVDKDNQQPRHEKQTRANLCATGRTYELYVYFPFFYCHRIIDHMCSRCVVLRNI